jgi:DeoR/GlpR family transcriptional regulator of sugar metabolism
MARRDQHSIEDRRQKILEEVCMKQEVNIADLAEKHNTSQMTIWRDLEILDKNNYIHKTQAGSVKKNVNLSLDPNIYNRSAICHAQKVSIALKAIELIEDNDVIGLDSSTTAMELARLFFIRKNITIISNNMLLLPILYDHPDLQFISAGGTLKQKGYSTEGDIATNTIQQFNYDKVFLSTNALDADFGLSNVGSFETGTKQAFIQNAARTILLCDSSKIGKKAVYRFCEMKDINLLITDSGISQEQLQCIRDKGVAVVIADERAKTDVDQ